MKVALIKFISIFESYQHVIMPKGIFAVFAFFFRFSYNISIDKRRKVELMTTEELIKENAELKQQILSMSNTIYSMLKTMEAMAESSDHQAQIIDELNETINKLVQNIDKLKEQLGKNSRNSFKPPSSDGLAKPTPKSLRKSVGRKPGGQKGHKGNGLTLMAAPDETIIHKPKACVGCSHESECKSCSQSAIRNVVDIEIKTTVTAHYTESYACPLQDNKIISGDFPESVTSSMQYGDNVKALAIALNTEGMMSIQRTHDILKSVLGLPISTGTVNTMVSKFADKISDTVEAIRKALLRESVVNCDETGIRTEGTNYWVHSACNDDYTYLSTQKKRGKEGMDHADFLPDYDGIIIHDFWQSYWKYNLRHGVCGAHLLRELNGVIDNHEEQRGWAEGFQKLLLKMNEAKSKAVEKGKTSISDYHRRKFSKEYDRIMEEAKKLNPEPKKVSGKRGKPAKGKILCLVDRLIEHKGEVCLFIHDFNVPFTNNIAERSIRMVKVKAKVSGCFRTTSGVNAFTNIKSYLGTAKKHGINTYEAIKAALAGDDYQLLFEAD